MTTKPSYLKIEVFVPVFFKVPFFLKKREIELLEVGRGQYKVKDKFLFLRSCPRNHSISYSLISFLVGVFLFLGGLYSTFQAGAYLSVLGLALPLGYVLILHGFSAGYLLLISFLIAVPVSFSFGESFFFKLFPGLYIGLGGIFIVSALLTFRKRCFFLCWEKREKVEKWPIWKV